MSECGFGNLRAEVVGAKVSYPRAGLPQEALSICRSTGLRASPPLGENRLGCSDVNEAEDSGHALGIPRVHRNENVVYVELGTIDSALKAP